jgi:hypothetical protein
MNQKVHSSRYTLILPTVVRACRETLKVHRVLRRWYQRHTFDDSRLALVMRSRTFSQAPTPRPHKPDQTFTSTGKWSLGLSHVVRNFENTLDSRSPSRIWEPGLSIIPSFQGVTPCSVVRSPLFVSLPLRLCMVG